MKILLDSHVLLWAADDPEKLSEAARLALESRADIAFSSIVSYWELQIKADLGKLTLRKNLEQILYSEMARETVTLLPISLKHIQRLSTLEHHHRDPFDRMLAAQALEEGLTFLSKDKIFDQYQVPRIW